MEFQLKPVKNLIAGVGRASIPMERAPVDRKRGLHRRYILLILFCCQSALADVRLVLQPDRTKDVTVKELESGIIEITTMGNDPYVFFKT